MDNHCHLVVRCSDKSLDKLMRTMNSRYAKYFNVKYKRRGYLFQDRFKSIITKVQNYLEQLIRLCIWILSGQGFVQVWMSWIRINGVAMLYWWVKAFVLFRPRIRCCLGSEQRLSQQESTTGNLWVKVQAESGMIGTFKKPERVIRELKEKTGLRAG